MDNQFFFSIFQRSTFNLEKKQKHLLRKILAHPIQVKESTDCGIDFQTTYINYVHNLERNWKKIVCKL